jgi:hypothetical protein
MKWIARIFVFTAALVFGTFAASLFVDATSQRAPAGGFFGPRAPIVTVKSPVNTESLLGAWKGNWGHNVGDCTLTIYRVEGNAFYGKLRKEGAEILFEGTLNPNTRRFQFDETKVVTLGSEMSAWSLGRNSGIISDDGHILVGEGHDDGGQYSWAASNY